MTQIILSMAILGLAILMIGVVEANAQSLDKIFQKCFKKTVPLDVYNSLAPMPGVVRFMEKDAIANMTGPIPFKNVTGNHELDVFAYNENVKTVKPIADCMRSAQVNHTAKPTTLRQQTTIPKAFTAFNVNLNQTVTLAVQPTYAQTTIQNTPCPFMLPVWNHTVSEADLMRELVNNPPMYDSDESVGLAAIQQHIPLYWCGLEK